MKLPFHTTLNRRHRRRGFLTVEWILLITLLVIGIVGGLVVVRDAILDELKDMSHAIQAITMIDCDEENEPEPGPDVCPPGDLSCARLP